MHSVHLLQGLRHASAHEPGQNKNQSPPHSTLLGVQDYIHGDGSSVGRVIVLPADAIAPNDYVLSRTGDVMRCLTEMSRCLAEIREGRVPN